jgi:heat-inducible transcriptional repressor
MELDARKQSILESIIRDYVATAEPVGSRAIARNHALKVSAATVRNEMSDLEQMGYLEQPHTSAGRIPSQQGLRYYVDCMMQRERLTDQELESLSQTLSTKMRDLEELLYSVGQYVAERTRYVSFVLIPALQLDKIVNVQIFPLQEGLALLVVLTDNGGLLSEKISLPPQVTEQDLHHLSQAFRQVLVGSSLHAIRRSDLRLLRESLGRNHDFLDQALGALTNLQTADREEKVLLSGVLNMLEAPEFKNVDQLRYLLALFEGKETMRHLLPEISRDGVDIVIGRENAVEESHAFSLVVSNFKTGGETGKIGLLGPVRMEYWKASGIIESVRAVMDEVLGFAPE